MNKLFSCLALAFFMAPILGSLYAEEGPPSEEYEPPPPVGLDVDYFSPPKQKMSLGFRTLSGPKVSFSGSGRIPSNVNPGADSTATTRAYNDGTVSPDARTDFTTGAAIPTTDGRTNVWSYSSASQVTPDGNGVAMHAYSATVNGNNPHRGRASSGTGFELTFERDFGWHLGKVQIDLIGGLGMNRISYSRSANVAAEMTTFTDTYSVYNPTGSLDADGNPIYPTTPTGPPPAAPYAAPSTDSNGNNNTTLLGSQPNQPGSTSLPTPALVTEQWNITGAYFTLRAGAQVTVPITEKFSASVSGGPALVYVGTTFFVNQTLTPPTGTPIMNTLSDNYNTVLPAYFANADIEYSLTDTTGLYLGAVFQSSTSYNQSIHSPDGNFTNKTDFGTQEGVRAGINFKF